MGVIKVTVQTEQRLTAINNMSIAIRKLAEALEAGTKVEITGCTIKGGDSAIQIETIEETTETKIEKA